MRDGATPMSTDRAPSGQAAKSLQLHVFAGAALLAGFAGGLGWWSASTTISGAVVASGTIVVEGGARRVQHPDGGVIAEILAADGDHVLAGAVLFRLDATSVMASRNIVLAQLRDTFARLARLAAELEGSPMPVLVETTPAALAGADLAALLETQHAFMQARAAVQQSRHAQIVEQINQLDEKIGGLAAQRTASQGQLTLLAVERRDLEALRADGLVEQSRINDIAQRQLQLEGSIGQVAAGIAEARATIAEHRALLAAEADTRRAEIIGEQQTTRAEIAQLLQQQVALDSQLARLEVRAPITGIVHGSTIHTVGGVVGAGETAMLVIPPVNGATVEARISPLDVEAVGAAQHVLLKFPGIETRYSPDLEAEVKSVSPDLTTDPSGAMQYYVARIIVPAEQLDRLPGHIPLVAGMPVNAFIRTTDRTVLEFLSKPLTDLLGRAFRED